MFIIIIPTFFFMMYFLRHKAEFVSDKPIFNVSAKLENTFTIETITAVPATYTWMSYFPTNDRYDYC